MRHGSATLSYCISEGFLKCLNPERLFLKPLTVNSLGRKIRFGDVSGPRDPKRLDRDEI